MTQNFLLNIMLTFVWVALTGELNYANFSFGFGLGFFLLWMINRTANSGTEYFYKVPNIIVFILYFLYDMCKANIQVTMDVLTPNFNMNPGIIKYETNAKTDFEVTMLCNMISLTPGTLVIHISDDKKFIYIHVMYIKDKQKFIDSFKRRTENRLLEILR
ncbi:MAG TPA: Na+/H+ antiporter subunit E [Flavobacterium sp.]|nr:Na+/H+ antiporter subunit E [Flavobacterium sp.]